MTSVVMTTQEFMTEVTEAAGWSESTLKNMGKTYEALYCAVSEGWKGRGGRGCDGEKESFQNAEGGSVIVIAPPF